MLLLSGCGSTYNQPATTGGSLPATKSGTDVTSATVNPHKGITTAEGYTPTQEDISRYNNDLGDFLTANVKGFSTYRKAMILVNGKEADSYTGISLNKVKTVSVLDPATAVRTYGTRAGNGAIVITTK